MKIIKSLIAFCISICCSGFAVAQDTPIKIEEGQIVLAWDQGKESDLKGHNLYYGTVSGKYDNIIDIDGPGMVKYTVKGLVPGVKYYLVLTAYDTSDNESGYSKEVSAIAKDKTAPVLPSGFKVVIETVNINANNVNIITTN